MGEVCTIVACMGGNGTGRGWGWLDGRVICEQGVYYSGRYVNEFATSRSFDSRTELALML